MNMTVKTTRGAEITGKVYAANHAPVSAATKAAIFANRIGAVVIAADDKIHAIAAGEETERVLAAIKAETAAFFADPKRVEAAAYFAGYDKVAKAMNADK
jgi:hypothetical protein